jgi:hypothetical protein
LDEETFKKVLLDKMINGETDDIQLRATELAAKVFGYVDNELNEELDVLQKVLDSSEVSDYEFRLPEIKVKVAPTPKAAKQASVPAPGDVPDVQPETETAQPKVESEPAPVDDPEVSPGMLDEPSESAADIPVAMQSE